MILLLHGAWRSLPLLILVTMATPGCKKPPKPQKQVEPKVRVDRSPCAQLVTEICTQCGEIAGPCQRLRRVPPTRQAQCRTAQKILSDTGTTAGRTYDDYCSMATWIAADVNRVSRRGSSAEPAPCRRLTFEVCHQCGKKSAACTNLKKRRAPPGASCKTELTALLRPRTHQLCQRASGWKALAITPPAP